MIFFLFQINGILGRSRGTSGGKESPEDNSFIGRLLTIR